MGNMEKIVSISQETDLTYTVPSGFLGRIQLIISCKSQLEDKYQMAIATLEIDNAIIQFYLKESPFNWIDRLSLGNLYLDENQIIKIATIQGNQFTHSISVVLKSKIV